MSTLDANATTRQNTIELIIIIDAVYTRWDVSRHDKSWQQTDSHSISHSDSFCFWCTPSTHATSDMNDKWIWNIRFVVSSVDSVRLKINVLTCVASKGKMLATAVSFNERYFEKPAACWEQFTIVHCEMWRTNVSFSCSGTSLKINFRCRCLTSTDRTMFEFDGLTQHLCP